MIPGEEAVLTLSRLELDGIIDAKGNASTDFLQLAYDETLRGYIIRGSKNQDVFPIDGPCSKHAALFNERVIFDGIREAFLVNVDKHLFLEQLRALLTNASRSGIVSAQVLQQGYAYARAVHNLVHWKQLRQIPVNFTVRVWPSYLTSTNNQ